MIEEITKDGTNEKRTRIGMCFPRRLVYIILERGRAMELGTVEQVCNLCNKCRLFQVGQGTYQSTKN